MNFITPSDLKLVLPSPDLKDAYIGFIEEFERAGEYRPQDELEFARANFTAFIHQLNDYALGIGMNPGLVPWTTYWLVWQDCQIIGSSTFRHFLNPHLEHEGGHIGYRIRPAERRKGYGTLILALTLEAIRPLGLERVLVTCDSDNLGSARIIEKNGGKLENQVPSKNTSKMISRYWIALY